MQCADRDTSFHIGVTPRRVFIFVPERQYVAYPFTMLMHVMYPFGINLSKSR